MPDDRDVALQRLDRLDTRKDWGRDLHPGMNAAEVALGMHRKGLEDSVVATLGHRMSAERHANAARKAKTYLVAKGHADKATNHAKKAQASAEATFHHAMGLNHKLAEPSEHENAMTQGDEAQEDASVASQAASDARFAAEKLKNGRGEADAELMADIQRLIVRKD